MINAVPKIQRDPRTVSQNAMHYGYVAYQDIQLGGKRVQPADSPYYHILPCRELLPFTNIEIGEIDERQVQNGKRPRGVPPVKITQKTAYECALEMEISYAEWAFQILHPLTGLDEDAAFRIFQVVQPFRYKLKDIQAELGGAEDRIDRDEPYTVSYDGDTIALEPLSEDEKVVARKIAEQIGAAANHAFDLGVKRQQETLTSMTKAFAGGDGKVTPDPLDRKLAKDFGTKLPQLVNVQEQEAAKQSESDALKREELELRRKEVELRERELEFREKEANRQKMAEVRAARKPEAQAA